MQGAQIAPLVREQRSHVHAAKKIECQYHHNKGFLMQCPKGHRCFSPSCNSPQKEWALFHNVMPKLWLSGIAPKDAALSSFLAIRKGEE